MSTVHPIKEIEVPEWVSSRIFTLASAVLFKEHTPEFWDSARLTITKEYYQSKPHGLVQLQSIITAEINLYNRAWKEAV